MKNIINYFRNNPDQLIGLIVKMAPIIFEIILRCIALGS